MYFPSGNNPRQTRPSKHVRMSGIQNPNTRPHLRVDVQLEDQGQAGQVDPGGSRLAAADIVTA